MRCLFQTKLCKKKVAFRLKDSINVPSRIHLGLLMENVVFVAKKKVTALSVEHFDIIGILFGNKSENLNKSLSNID